MGVVETGMDAAMAEGKADGGFNTDDQGTNNNMGTNPSLVAGAIDMIAEGSADDSFNNTDGCDTDDNMGVNPRPMGAGGCKGGDAVGGPKRMLASSTEYPGSAPTCSTTVERLPPCRMKSAIPSHSLRYVWIRKTARSGGAMVANP
jgi:hypothetical protein